MSLEGKLLDIVSQYAADGLYIGDGISEKRRQSAINSHGVDPRDALLAVLDSTILGHTRKGSARTGMSITPKGIYWKNPWVLSTGRTFYPWDQFSEVAPEMIVSNGEVLFEPGVEFYTPASFDAQRVISLLRALSEVWMEEAAASADGMPGEEADGASVLTKRRLSKPMALGRALALLCVGTDGLEEDRLGLSIELVEEAEGLGNRAVALQALQEAVEKLAAEAARSKTFLKLARARVIAELPVLNKPDSEQLRTMCETVAAVGIGGGGDLITRITSRMA